MLEETLPERGRVILMMNDYIYDEVGRVVRKYRTRDPFELLDCLNAELRIAYHYGKHGLKGFSTVANRLKFVVINGRLNEYEQRVVAGHEAAHLAIHMDELLKSPARMLKDFNLWDDSGRIERQANLFTADFMLDDDAVMDVVQYGGDDRDFFGAARELYVPPPLLAFKLYSMMRRGFDVRVPVDLDSKFLGR